MMPFKQEFCGETELPHNEGTYSGPFVYRTDLGMAYQDGKWSLTGITSEHVLFSAVALSYSGIDFDPVALYWAEHDLPRLETPLYVECGKKILDGLPLPLDQVIFACPKPYAPGLLKFLDRFAAQRPNGVMCESVHQRLQMVDWPLLKNVSVAPPKPPIVPVELYGIEVVGKGSFLWHHPKNAWKDPIILKQPVKPPLPLSQRPRQVLPKKT